MPLPRVKKEATLTAFEIHPQARLQDDFAWRVKMPALYDSFANFSHSRRKGSALPRHERQKRGWGESSHKKCCLGESILETQLSHPGSLRGKNGSASMLLSRGLPAGAARRGRKGCALMMLPRGLAPFSPAGSGAVCQWQTTKSADRSGA